MEILPLFSLRRLLCFALSLILLVTSVAVAVPVSASINHDHDNTAELDAAYGTLIKTSIQGECDYEAAFEVLDIVNKERKKANLSPLSMDEELLEAAMLRAAECAIYYSHNRPSGDRCFSVLDRVSSAGENIAAGYTSASKVMQAWMSSEGHKFNIMASDFRSIGVGVFKIDGIYYWSQYFNGAKQQKAPTQNKADVKTIPIEARTGLLNLNINHTSLSLGSGETATIKVENRNKTFYNIAHQIDPSGLSFDLDKYGVVTVSGNGTVTPIGKGSATITVKSKNGVKLFTVSVTAEVKNPHKHEYTAATCTTPKTCKMCGATSGTALGHTYDNGCDATCNACGENRKVAHIYSNTCDTTCNECGATRKVGAHTWVKGTCSACGAACPNKVTIVTEPKTTYVLDGAKASVKVVASGEGLKYTWYIKNNGGTKYSKSSVTKTTYSATLTDTSHNRYLYCVITDQYGNEVKTKTVCIRRQATITGESATAAYAQTGKKASVKITAVGDGLKYTWYIKNEGATKYSKSSVTTATYSATMGSKVKGRKVYCLVTDKYGKSVQSKTFVLRESVSITTQPATITVKKNTTAKVSVKASGDGLKYAWYIKNEGQTKYSKSSVTTATYATTMNAKAKNRLVYCVVTDKYGNTVKSVTVKLKMK